jgi:MFS family permease
MTPDNVGGVHDLLIALGVVTAVAAAAYSTWSPCGQSMLSQLTPLGERARGRRFGVTAAWFIAGALLGGAMLGGVTAALAAGVGATDLSASGALAVAAVLALASAALDAHLVGVGPPYFRRQVDEEWLVKYRAWLYGGGFGWQIGTGVTTYIMTTAVFLTIALGALTGNPLAAFVICLVFAGARGLAVLLARRITTPAALASFHRVFDALGPKVRRAVIAVQIVVAAVAAGVAWTPVAAVIVVVVAGAAGALSAAGRGARARTHPELAAAARR